MVVKYIRGCEYDGGGVDHGRSTGVKVNRMSEEGVQQAVICIAQELRDRADEDSTAETCRALCSVLRSCSGIDKEMKEARGSKQSTFVGIPSDI